ncbi:hypothetical protein PFISCL1PPCAC_13756, partial [Pristionchus fissidentatus]
LYFSAVPENMEWEDVLKRCIDGYSLCKNKINGKSCNSTRSNVRVEVQKGCWVIDMDVSVISPHRSKETIQEIPLDITVGETAFRMSGVVLYNGLHYVSVLPYNEQWIYYDGM